MVTGIDSFKEWFKGSEEQYAIIGETACDILMTEKVNINILKDDDVETYDFNGDLIIVIYVPI